MGVRILYKCHLIDLIHRDCDFRYSHVTHVTATKSLFQPYRLLEYHLNTTSFSFFYNSYPTYHCIKV
jgi:hypothetical protein